MLNANAQPHRAAPAYARKPRIPVTPGGLQLRSCLATVSSFPECEEDWLTAPFASVNLEQLNAKASMLVRLDNKYILGGDAMRDAMAKFSEAFDVLEIDGRRRFTYETCYFDDAERSCYYDHHRGRKKRFKVRLRKYVDAGLCFVEVKLKGKRGITHKRRLKQPLDQYGKLNAEALKHIETSYRELYGKPFDYTMEQAVEMRYQRVTLVKKAGDERMTIDFNLQFSYGGKLFEADPNTFIIETKSPNANGAADKVLRQLHQHPTKRCSKYCVAMATLEAVGKHNKFLPAMRKLGAFDHELVDAPLATEG